MKALTARLFVELALCYESKRKAPSGGTLTRFCLPSEVSMELDNDQDHKTCHEQNLNLREKFVQDLIEKESDSE